MLSKSIQKMTYAGFVFVLLALPVSAQEKEMTQAHSRLEHCRRYVKDHLIHSCYHICRSEITQAHDKCSQVCEKLGEDFNGHCIFWNTPSAEKTAS
jgi:hypothetical protein